MRCIAAVAGCLLLTTGCGTHGLRALANTQAAYFTELQRTMPAAIDVHEVVLRTALGKAQQAQEQEIAAAQAQALKGVIDQAIAGAGLNVSAPTWDGVHGALARLMKYQEDQLVLVEAARAARDAKAKAVLDALQALSASVPALVAHQNAIADYLEAQGRLIPLGGVSVTERPQDVAELIERLKTMSRNLEDQFTRAQQIYDAAKKAAAGGGR